MDCKGNQGSPVRVLTPSSASGPPAHAFILEKGLNKEVYCDLTNLPLLCNTGEFRWNLLYVPY